MVKLRVLLALAAAAAATHAAAGGPLPPSPFPPCTTDQQVVKDRLLAPLLPQTSTKGAAAAKGAAALAASLRSDGSWADVNYNDQTRGTWAATTHLSRLKAMAVAVRSPMCSSVNSTALLASANKGLAYWLQGHFTNPNWYWNEIGVPQLLVDIFLLLEARVRVHATPWPPSA
eukprot:SAG11_NODE_11436_length_761_cov_0.808157_2_plen_173_part_00